MKHLTTYYECNNKISIHGYIFTSSNNDIR